MNTAVSQRVSRYNVPAKHRGRNALYCDYDGMPCVNWRFCAMTKVEACVEYLAFPNRGVESCNKCVRKDCCAFKCFRKRN